MSRPSYDTRARAALPDVAGVVSANGNDAPIEISRDGLGVPHVRARTTHDAFFAQGFVHAQDRLWQMEYDRRRAAGRLAETIGRSGLAMDVFVRRMGVLDAARADVAALDSDARAVLDAYAAGVNAFIDSTRALPLEFSLLQAEPEPWQGWHCAAVMKVRHVLMGPYDYKLWRYRLLRALGPDAVRTIGAPGGREDTVIAPVGGSTIVDLPDIPLELFAEGSNNWVVHGSRTASGMPLLAGDPHRALEVPNVYYQNRIAGPEFDVIGLSIPGIPGFFHFGHNGAVAWCITHAMADTQDLYIERFADGRVLTPNGWLDVERREETISVRGEAPAHTSVVRTPNGPIMFGDPSTGTAISMRWTGTDAPNGSLGVVLPMLRARSVEELDDRMRAWVDPCNCMLMADQRGATAFLHRGRVPIRPAINGLLPVPGWDPKHTWGGDVPFERWPRLRDPEQGFIVTANNRVVDEAFPYYLSTDYAAPHRARSILERLANLDAATVDDMAAIHRERRSIPARAFTAALGRVAASGRAETMRRIVASWDGSMEPDATAPAVYAAFRDELAGLLLEEGPLAAVADDPYHEDPYATPTRARVRGVLARFLDDGTAIGLNDDRIREALDRTAARLTDALGPDIEAWRWGALHRTNVRHPLSRVLGDAASLLDPPRVASGGDGDTVNATGHITDLGIQHASVARYVFDIGDWDRSGWIVPLGSSGHPASPHYADQAQDWADVRLRPMTYTWDRLDVVTRQELT